MPNVLAIAEQKDGEIRRVSAEVVTAARDVADAVGGEVHVLVLGPATIADAAGELAGYGADTIFAGADDAFAEYNPEGYAAGVSDFLRERDYFAVLFGASGTGKDLAPRVAARLEVPLATEATGLTIEDDELVVTRPVYAGKAYANVVLQAEPRLVSLRPNVFNPQERNGAGTVESVDLDPQPDSWRVKVREVRGASGEAPDVGDAPIVVSGGRGLQGPENWEMLEDLRARFGPQAALGASRAVVDAGWRPHSEQVGQTGKTVAPRLYVAVAISGAIQHLAGMRTASTIVAINKDPEAPIFKVADYGIVGDAFEVVPKLTEEVRKVQQG